MRRSAVDWADAVVLSGGGILYDRAPKNVENYMRYVDYAVSRGKRAAVLGAGVQGIVTEDGRRRYRESLSRRAFVSVRTADDKRALAASFERAGATLDIAFFARAMLAELDVAPGPLRRRRHARARTAMLDSDRPKIGIAVSDLRTLKGRRYGGNFADFDQSIDDFVAAARERFDVYLLQHARSDARRLRALARTHGATLIRYLDIADMDLYRELLVRLDLMIRVRLHAIVLGMTMGIPTIGIGTAGAKQHRLARYEMPTLARQFYSFSMIERLRGALERIAATGKVTEQALGEAERKRITRLNNENLELIRSLWA